MDRIIQPAAEKSATANEAASAPAGFDVGDQYVYDAFFLAMLRWQMGDREGARVWYDRAVEWMACNSPYDQELDQFRAEAGALLRLRVAE